MRTFAPIRFVIILPFLPVLSCKATRIVDSDSGTFFNGNHDLLYSFDTDRRQIQDSVPNSDLYIKCKHQLVKKKCNKGWCFIPAGCFLMGSPKKEPCREVSSGKETLHEVTLKRSFRIMSKEVTQGVFQSVMGYNLSQAITCGTECPVERVTWHEAAAFSNVLSSKSGFSSCYDCSGKGTGSICAEKMKYVGYGKSIYQCPGYRLPTEAEWEYAVRSGTITAFYIGPIHSGVCEWPPKLSSNASKIGWNKDNSGDSPHFVGQKWNNQWGLFDMSGNVSEWVNDRFQEDLGSVTTANPVGPNIGAQRTVRGGAYTDKPQNLRSAWRSSAYPMTRSQSIGFRLARTSN